MAHFRLSIASFFIDEFAEKILNGILGLKSDPMVARIIDRAGSARNPRKSLLN